MAVEKKTVAQLKRANFKFWNSQFTSADMTSEQANEVSALIESQSVALNYIEHLAASTSTDISAWNILAVFSTNECEIETDRNRINELFFEATSEIKLATRPNVDQATLKQEILESCKELGEVQLQRRKESMQQKLEEQRDAIQHCQERLNSAVSTAYETKQTIESFNGQSILSDEIEKISKNQFWQFEKLVGDQDSPILYLQTSAECVVRHRNDSLNFGKFRAKISLADPSIRVLPLSNNLHCNFRYYHPHVSGDGAVCWGNASGTVNDNLVDGKVSDVVQLLQSLLMYYNADNPYESFESFSSRGSRLRNYSRFSVVEMDQRQARGRGEDVSVYPAVPRVPVTETEAEDAEVSDQDQAEADADVRDQAEASGVAAR
jgi:hypothetical protein